MHTRHQPRLFLKALLVVYCIVYMDFIRNKAILSYIISIQKLLYICLTSISGLLYNYQLKSTTYVLICLIAAALVNLPAIIIITCPCKIDTGPNKTKP